MSRSVIYSRETKLDTVKGLIAMARAGHHSEAREWAVSRWGEGGAPQSIHKATGAIVSGDMGALYSDSDLFAAVRESSILFRMRGVRKVSFNTRAAIVSGLSAAWLGEGKPMPIVKASFVMQ